MFHRFNRAKIENRKRTIFEQREDNKIEETCDTIIDPVREKSSIESREWAKGSWKRTIWGINRGEGGGGKLLESLESIISISIPSLPPPSFIRTDRF